MKSQRNKTLTFIDLVPKLIANSKGLSNELNNRIKSNHLFSEFEIKASNQFKFFLKESEKRHLGSKYGTKMDYILRASKKRGQKEAFKILNDNFYLDKDLLKERKKMLKKSTNEIHYNITNIINKIKGVKKVKNFWENNHSNKSTKNYRKKIKPLNNDILLGKDKILFDNKKQEINTMFNDDEKKMKNFFDAYKTYLTNVENITYEKTENNIGKKIYNKINFNVPQMQLLNYTKSFTHMKTKRDIDNENRINLKKLMQYSISKKDISPFEQTKKFCVTVPNQKKEDNYLETRYTNKLVFQKALNECKTFRNKFINKNEIIKEKLGLDQIPSFKDYEYLIKYNFNKMKKKRIYLNEIKYENQKFLGQSNKEILLRKIDENLNYLENFENDLKSKKRKNKNLITI